MRARLGLLRTRDDEGAIAILISLVFLFVMLPAVALGMSSYTRDGVRDEKARSADSGALAGAAALTLINTSLPLSTPIVNVKSPPNALAAASTACAAALQVDQTLSTAFASPPGSGTPECVPSLAGNTQLAPCLAATLAAFPLPGGLGSVTIPSLNVPPIVDPLTGMVLVPGTSLLVGGTLNLGSLLQSLAPGLFNDSLTMTVNYQVAGPLDVIFGLGGKTTTSVSATAQRRFKALLPDLAIPPIGTPPVPTPVGSVPATGLPPAQALVVDALQSLLAELQALVGQVPIVPLPLGTLLGPVLGPLLPPGTPTLPNPTVGLSPVCTTAIQEVIEDLQEALDVDPGNTSTTALSCAMQIILGLDPTLPGVPLSGAAATVNANCTNTLFRSRLIT